jgi:ubiquinone/menaquinone biosynthesis C-methylase UbiE
LSKKVVSFEVVKKRLVLDLKKDFNDKSFAELYIKKHKKILRKLGYYYAEKLKNRGFCYGKIIDVGCGFGEMCLVFAREFPDCEVVGVDLSVPLLDYARDSISEEMIRNRVKFEKGSVEKMNFEDNSFDVVFNVNMIHWISDPISMLNEIERILKPEGSIFIKDLRYSWLKMFEKEINSAFTLEQAKKVIGDSGLRGGSFSSNLLWWNFEA